MTASTSTAVYPGPELLCVDAPIGRIVTPGRHVPTCAPTYLSVDIEFSRRDTKRETINEAAHGYRFGGPLVVLGIQVRERRFTQRKEPSKWVKGFDEFGLLGGRWPLVWFQLRASVRLVDLLRLAELSRLYNHNMATPSSGPSTAVFIPREHERELRDIAARLAV